ncbi:MAG: hypothetical protein WAU86_08650 [Oricola sp.]
MKSTSTTRARRAVLAAIGGVVMTVGMGVSARAAVDHWDRFSCYAYVHDQCYGNGQNNCSSEDYNWGLDQCDGYYPASVGVKRPVGPKNLVAPTKSRQTRAILGRSFNK